MAIQKKEQSMRKTISTTLRVDLWQALQMDALRRGVYANDILEELIEKYLERLGKRPSDTQRHEGKRLERPGVLRHGTRQQQDSKKDSKRRGSKKA
jgi:hypothetical protein